MHIHATACTAAIRIYRRRPVCNVNSLRPRNRFLQAEAGPWGHLSPSPRSPTRTPAISPGAVSSSSHLSPRASPGGPSPTTPPGPARSASGSRGPAPPRQYRGRTSSMPAVPRHRVSHRVKRNKVNNFRYRRRGISGIYVGIMATVQRHKEEISCLW